MTWRQVQLKQVASISVSNVDKKSAEHERSVMLCNYVDVYKNNLIDASLDFMRATASPAQIRSFGLRAGDTIITKDSETAHDIAVPAYIGEAIEDLVCGYHLAIVRPGPEVLPRYLFWCLASQSMREQAAVAATGVTRYGLRRESMRNFLLELPSLDEQQRIVAFLDAETARIDRVIELRHAQQALLEEEHALLSTFFGTALPTSQESTVKHLTTLITSGPRGWGDFLSPEGSPFVRIGNVSRRGIRLDLRDLAMVQAPGGAERERSRTRDGDVLVSITADLGSVGVVSGDACGGNVSQHIALLRPIGGECVPEWLAWAIKSPQVQGRLLSAGYGGTKQGLSLADVANLRLLVPSLADQTRTANDIGARWDASSQAVSALSRGIVLLSERRSGLLTAAVTGQLDVSTARGAA